MRLAGTEMDESVQPFLGSVEPHAFLLNVPPAGQLLYKVTTVENLLRSIAGSYLHFNRVDSYGDLSDPNSNADHNDGGQLPADRQGNARSRFKNAPDYSAADYYDQSRSRTYACCFSLENSEYIWEKYANKTEQGKVCLVFHFGKLRATLNETLQPGNASLNYNSILCHQIFSLNYGIIDYVEWDTHRANRERLPNPIIYTYLKDRGRFAAEKELRVSLSTLGIGEFALKDGEKISFPPSLQLAFDFRAAFIGKTIVID
jgi:hypothetical protein